MKSIFTLSVAMIFSNQIWAEDISGETEILCSSGRASLCVEDGECFSVPPGDIDIPGFVIIDTDKKSISTTRASGLNRSTMANGFERKEGKIFMQGIDNGRAFSFIIEENSGILTAAVAHRGVTVSVFGACTSADVK